MRSVAIFVLALGMAFAPAYAGAAEPLQARVFDYQHISAEPPVLGERRIDGVIVRDIEIPASGTAGRAARAYVVVPPGAGPFGAALMVHWLGEPDLSNRSEFLDDAIALAHRGIVSVLPDAMWSAPHWYTQVRGYATDYDASIEQVRDLRRALDVLMMQPGIDRNRVAYVGHDFGAMYGAVMSAFEPRVRYYALMAGTTSFNDWYLYGKPPADRAAYVARMAPLDPVLYLREATIQDALFQFARSDFYIPPKKFAEFYVADHGKKTLRLYDADHDLAIPAAIADRRAWLIERCATR